MNRPLILQAIVIVGLATLFSFGYNSIRGNGIPLIPVKKELQSAEISNLELLIEDENYEPIIKGVDLYSAKEMFDRGVIFVDVRDEDEYQVVHIKGALNLSVPELAENISFDDPVVVYCDGEECDLSDQYAESMLDFGFSKIFIFRSGWIKWREAGYPVE